LADKKPATAVNAGLVATLRCVVVPSDFQVPVVFISKPLALALALSPIVTAQTLLNEYECSFILK